MKTIIVGVVIGILLVPIGGYLFLASGNAPVAASAPPLPLEKFLAKTGLHAKLRKEAPQRDVSNFTDADLQAGASVYVNNCAFCHGQPQLPVSAAAKGMFPDPPQLFEPKDMVTDDPAGVTYWKVRNGIRLSGMPGFKDSLTDKQMWDVSALLARADKLPPSVLDALNPPPAASPPPSEGAAAAGKGTQKKK